MERIPFYIYCSVVSKCESCSNILYYLMIIPFVAKYFILFRFATDCICVVLCSYDKICSANVILEYRSSSVNMLCDHCHRTSNFLCVLLLLLLLFNCRVCECLENCHSNSVTQALYRFGCIYCCRCCSCCCFYFENIRMQRHVNKIEKQLIWIQFWDTIFTHAWHSHENRAQKDVEERVYICTKDILSAIASIRFGSSLSLPLDPDCLQF